MATEIRLSIEETNKLRAQLGLTLLPTESSDRSITEQKQGRVPSRDATNNGSQTKSSLSIEETNKLRRSLGLRPLESEPSELESNDKTSLSSNQSSHVTTSRKEPELQEKEGIQIAHSARQLANIQDGEVFTLEDKDILDEDEDRFENEKLVKMDKQEKIDRERRKMGLSRSNFSNLMYNSESEQDDEPEEIRAVGSKIALPKEKSSTIQDIPTENVVTISGLFGDLDEEPKPKESKKPPKFKKSKNKASSKKRTLDVDIDQNITGATEMVTLVLTIEEEDFDDIEDSLAKSRREKARARTHMTAEQIAAEAKMNLRLDAISDLKDGIVFDGTNDFLESLSSLNAAPAEITEESTNISGPIKDEEGKEAVTSHEPNEASSVAKDDTTQLPEIDTINKPRHESEEENQIEEEQKPEEAKFASVSSTLKYLRQTSATTSEAEKQAYKVKREKEKEQSLVRIKISIQERIVREELEKDSSYGRMSQEEKDKTFDRVLSERLVSEGIIADIPTSGRYNRYNSQVDDLADYNPQVHVTHKDEKGQVLDQKQAWKVLSHRYHGLAPKHAKRAKLKSRSERTV